METKSHKITQLERLQMQRIKLHAEAEAHWSALDDQWDYLQDNLGSLMMGSAINAVKSKLPPVIAGLLPSSGGKSTDNKTMVKSKSSGLSATAESVLDMALDSIPFLIKGPRAVIIALVLKKLKKLFL